MALLTCPDCGRDISDQARECPGCGRPMLKIETRFIEVWFDGEDIRGERNLNNMLRDGWEIVDQNNWVEWEQGHSIDITKYKLQRRVHT